MAPSAFSGKWKARFVSPAGNVHDFEMLVDNPVAAPSVSLVMTQTKQGDTAPSLSVNFNTVATVSGAFIGLLSKDPGGLGFNCMALHLANDTEALNGQIIWNSITNGCVEHGEIEFQRSPD